MKKKILVVEDEKELADLVKLRLEANGYEVEVAYDGEEGLEKAISYEPDLVVLDLMLPKIGGLEALQKIKRPDSDMRGSPIVILSALKDTNTMLNAEKLGAADYIMKPYDPNVLLALVKKYI